jgi:hypothetical protein
MKNYQQTPTNATAGHHTLYPGYSAYGAGASAGTNSVAGAGGSTVMSSSHWCKDVIESVVTPQSSMHSLASLTAPPPVSTLQNAHMAPYFTSTMAPHPSHMYALSQSPQRQQQSMHQQQPVMHAPLSVNAFHAPPRPPAFANAYSSYAAALSQQQTSPAYGFDFFCLPCLSLNWTYLVVFAL